jgi:hypothetical protein
MPGARKISTNEVRKAAGISDPGVEITADLMIGLRIARSCGCISSIGTWTSRPLSPCPNSTRITEVGTFSAGASVFYGRAIILSLFVATAGISLAAGRDLAVVSNKANALSGIALPDLMKICKGQTHHWPDGKSVTFIMRSPATPEMKVVVEKLYESSESQVKELVSTANHGRPGHPAIIIVNSDEELVNRVASIPGAVGVVDVYSINSSVSVVKLAGKLPLEPGYLLHGN